MRVIERDRTNAIVPITLIGLFLLLATLLVGFSGCDTGATEPEDILFPEDDVSYARHVQPLFDLGCNFSGCHNGTDRGGGLALVRYIDLFSRPGLVIPGDSATSLLVQVIGSRQPHTYPINRIISADQARGVALWVEEGASNN